MRATTAEYRALLQALLPTGGAWPRAAAAVLTKLLHGLAGEPTRGHNRACDLVEESDPRTAAETITDWERVTGLPDACAAAEVVTLQQRRAAVHAKLTARGGQSRQFYIDLAAALGYAITITEFRPFRVGQSTAGDPCTDEDWWFVWQVNAPETTIIEFKAGASTAGEPLRAWGNKPLECVITRLKPAHTEVQFAYGG